QLQAVRKPAAETRHDPGRWVAVHGAPVVLGLPGSRLRRDHAARPVGRGCPRRTHRVMMPQMVAALYVEKNGVYYGLPDVDPWDKERDARNYAGPFPVVAHP